MAQAPEFMVTMTKTIRDKPKLCLNGYAYIIEKRKPDKIYWKCEIHYMSCGGRLTTTHDVIQPQILIGPNEHSHNPDATHCDVIRITNNMKKRALDTYEPPGQIIHASLAAEIMEVKLALPTANALTQIVKRSRSSKYPKEPDSLNQLGDRFLYGALTTACGFKCLLFTTLGNLQHLSRATSILADGTFKVVPHLFTQLYTLHCSITNSSKVLPMVYCLMEKKYKPSYKLVDFEIGTINAAREVFPNTAMHGCFFHLAKSVYRHVQHEHLQQKYAVNAEFSLLVRQLSALAFLPVHEINAVYQRLKPLFPPVAE
uniref:FLYWCH-type domain-containing protein n=1 Tax=Strigamia maritima TaxID=126957 RepID=T1JMR8_STRMM